MFFLESRIVLNKFKSEKPDLLESPDAKPKCAKPVKWLNVGLDDLGDKYSVAWCKTRSFYGKSQSYKNKDIFLYKRELYMNDLKCDLKVKRMLSIVGFLIIHRT